MTLKQAVDEMTPKSVEAWLETQPQGRLFFCAEPCRCVVAQYLADKIGVYVSTGGSSAHASGHLPVRLQKWVREFVFNFDSGDLTPRSVNDTLGILRETCPELAASK